MPRIRITLLLEIAVFASILVIRAVSAGEARVSAAEAEYLGKDLWTISATILHADTGWEHYADRWDVISPSGIVLGSRKLLHPHVNVQPFTRSLPNLHIPSDIDQVRIRANDSIHGENATEFVLQLDRTRQTSNRFGKINAPWTRPAQNSTGSQIDHSSAKLIRTSPSTKFN